MKRTAVRVLVIFGTRPEAIKMAPVIQELKKHNHVETLVCVTGQHRALLDQALRVFSIVPDFDLDIMSPGQTLSAVTAAVLERISTLIRRVQPDRVIVHGDTTTSFASALASFYANVPVGHVEAGLRTGNIDAPWPEEYNRRVVDIISDLLWAPTEIAANTLRGEGVHSHNIFVTGNTVIDALLIGSAIIDENDALRETLNRDVSLIDSDRKLVLVTSHRRESFDTGLANLCRALNVLAARTDVEVVWPVHLNPEVMRIVQTEIRVAPNIHLLKPRDYLEFLQLMRQCHFIITDSGGIQEEAPTLSKPVLVARAQTERPEAAIAGAAKIVGTDTDDIVAAAELLLEDAPTYRAMANISNPFGDGQAAPRIVASILQKHG